MKMKTAFIVILCGIISSTCGAMLVRALSPGEDTKDIDNKQNTVVTTTVTTVETNKVECETEEPNDVENGAYLPQITPGLEGPSAE